MLGGLLDQCGCIMLLQSIAKVSYVCMHDYSVHISGHSNLSNLFVGNTFEPVKKGL